MRTLDANRKHIILDYINAHYGKHGTIPSFQEISAGTGIATTSVHRYMQAMKAAGELNYDGRRNIGTRRMEKERPSLSLPVLGTVTCGPGDYEEENILEYIRMPEALVGKGTFFALIAKGESMVDAGIFPGDYVIVRIQDTAEDGDIVVALYDDGLSNLKKLRYDPVRRQRYLYSCNGDQATYAPIFVHDLHIQGVAVCTIHNIGKLI